MWVCLSLYQRWLRAPVSYPDLSVLVGPCLLMLPVGGLLPMSDYSCPIVQGIAELFLVGSLAQ